MNKKLLAIAVSSALVAPLTANAIDFKISGHINRLIRFADDGQGSDVQHMDNSASRSRFRFTGSGDLTPGVKVGVNFETSIASNATNGSGIKSGDGGDTRFDLRHSAIYFAGDWGTLWAGHTSSASDGAAFADLSGTFLVDELSSAVDYASPIAFRTTRGAAGRTIGGAFASYDGGRRDILRYDTPALGPVTLKISAGQNEYYDIGAYVDTDLGGGSLALAAGYSHNGNTTNDIIGAAETDQWAVSGSFKFSQGTNISLMYGQGDSDAQRGGRADADGDTFYAKLGHQWGNHSVSVSYADVSQDGSRLTGVGIGGPFTFSNETDLEVWGVGWQYNMPKPGVQFYAGYHNFDLEEKTRPTGGPTTSANFDDIDVFVIGSRVAFK